MNYYEEIARYIKSCYECNEFDENLFQFYKLRKEKGTNRAGIFCDMDKKYFFKLVDLDEYNDENEIVKMIRPDFDIVEKYLEYRVESQVLNLYKYVDAPSINAFNYLRDSNIPYIEKKDKLYEFFEKKIKLMNNTSSIDNMVGDRRSDRWFYKRINKNGRITAFYGKNNELLLGSIREICPELLNYYIDFFNNIYDYLKEDDKTMFSYSHGDFHDFNFSLNGIFWDTDTFDYNPVLNDFIVFYWHFYAREDSLIYKYSPWLTHTMYDKLSNIELTQIRNLKQEIILKWYNSLKILFSEYKIEDNIYKEFIFKLFCRVFLIDNVLKYDLEDQRKVYQYFSYYIRDNVKDIEELLFSNPNEFSYEKDFKIKKYI